MVGRKLGVRSTQLQRGCIRRWSCHLVRHHNRSPSEPFTSSIAAIRQSLLLCSGVCISDLIPFYLGKLFRQSGVSDDVSSRLGIGQEKALEITAAVQKYGNLIGFVERFSVGARNPTAFLAGALGISPECFFAGVCCGGLFTLPIQLEIGFLLRERPVFALATVATVVVVATLHLTQLLTEELMEGATSWKC